MLGKGEAREMEHGKGPFTRLAERALVSRAPNRAGDRAAGRTAARDAGFPPFGQRHTQAVRDQARHTTCTVVAASTVTAKVTWSTVATRAADGRRRSSRASVTRR